MLPMMVLRETLSVSVVIACHKNAHHLIDAIESVLRQTHPRIEIVLVDDGLSNNIAQVAASYPGIRYICIENQGISQARNAGLRLSRGDYVIFLAAADRLTRHAVEAHLRCFAEHSEAAFTVGFMERITRSGANREFLRRPLLQANQYEELLKMNHPARTTPVMFRRTLVQNLGGFKTAFEPAEEYEMLLRTERSLPGVHHRTIVAEYRCCNIDMPRRGARLIATLLVLRAQRPFIEGNARLEAALQDGVIDIEWAVIWLYCAETLLQAYSIVRFSICTLVATLWRSLERVMHFARSLQAG